MRARALGLTLVLLSLLAGATPAPAGQAPTVPIRLAAGALERAGVEARWVERYGPFEWAEVAEEDLAALRSAGARFEVHREVRRLVLPSASFDPLVRVPGTARPGAAESLALVQLRAPGRDSWLDAIRARGVRLVQPIAPFAYVVLADAASIAAVRDIPAVRWAGAFDPAWRFGAPSLRAGAVNVVLLDDGRLPASLDAIGRIAAEVRPTVTLPFMDVDAVGLQVRLGDGALAALARVPAVYSISPQRRGQPRDEMSDQIVAGNITDETGFSPGYRDWLDGHGVTGEGVVVAHVDDGFTAAHPDTAGTISGCKNYAAPEAPCDPNTGPGSDFHGIHTGGIIVGQGPAPIDDAQGFRYGLGVAPGASLFVQNFISFTAANRYTGPGQYQLLNRDSVLGGATISANSWGPAGSPQGYDADTREFDHAPRDADLETPEHDPLAFVLSIMNGGGGTSTQGSPDEGKNLLRVGSTKNGRAGDIEDLSGSSAHGPALDGRLVVDVVAPGERVVSAANPLTIGLCGDPVPGAGVALYSHCTGTSMASPHVSGGAALFTEHYREAFGADPSPALIKGAFVNGAVDLAGGLDADDESMGHVPDHRQGWGRLHLGNVLGGAEKAYLDQSVVLGSTGASYTASVEPVDPSQPLKVTLVWTDAPGHGLGGEAPAWVNDLDLRVTAGGTTFLGNAFGQPSTGWSVPGGTADQMNNLENVFLQDAPDGAVTLEVRAASIAGDGVPGNEDDTDQDFALVVSNGRLAA